MQDLTVGVALGSHHRSSDLAQPYAVSPAGTVKSKPVPVFFNDESGTVKMCFGKSFPDNQFFADGHRFPATGYFYPDQASRRTSLYGNNFMNSSEVDAQFPMDQLGERLGCERFFPAKKMPGFPVIVI